MEAMLCCTREGTNDHFFHLSEQFKSIRQNRTSTVQEQCTLILWILTDLLVCLLGRRPIWTVQEQCTIILWILTSDLLVCLLGRRPIWTVQEQCTIILWILTSDLLVCLLGRRPIWTVQSSILSSLSSSAGWRHLTYMDSTQQYTILWPSLTTSDLLVCLLVRRPIWTVQSSILFCAERRFEYPFPSHAML